MTRLDTYLKNTGLIRQRGEAKRACQAGRIQVDGRPAKASRTVSAGEIISIILGDTYLEAEVLAVPERPPARNQRQCYYRLIRQERQDVNLDFEF